MNHEMQEMCNGSHSSFDSNSGLMNSLNLEITGQMSNEMVCNTGCIRGAGGGLYLCLRNTSTHAIDFDALIRWTACKLCLRV